MNSDKKHYFQKLSSISIVDAFYREAYFDSQSSSGFKYFVSFFSQYFLAFKRCGWALLLVYIVFTLLDQTLTLHIESQLRSSDGASPWIILSGAAYLTNSIFFTTLAALVALYGLNTQGLGLVLFLQTYLNQACIEIVRSWGKVLSWSLLLIIPGLIKYLHFLFVPVVVTQNIRYQDGEVDALKVSSQIFKKLWFRTLMIYVFFQIILAYFSISFFDSYRQIWNTPLQSILVSLLEASVFLIYIFIILKLYKLAAGKVGAYESHV